MEDDDDEEGAQSSSGPESHFKNKEDVQYLCVHVDEYETSVKSDDGNESAPTN